MSASRKRINWKSSPSWIFVALLIYLAILLFFIRSHEFWRDEVSAFSIASGSHSLQELWVNTRNFGNPLLWYLVLYVAKHVASAATALQVSNIVICVAALWLFLKNSPFRISEKCLFIFGYFPLYQYGLIARHYSLLMLGLFTALSLYHHRQTKMGLYIVALGFLANTHVLGLIMAVVLLTDCFFEHIWTKKYITLRWDLNHLQIWAGLALFAFSCLSILTQGSSQIFSPQDAGQTRWGWLLVSCAQKLILEPEWIFSSLLIGNWFIAKVVSWAILIAVARLLWHKRMLWMLLTVGLLMSLLFEAVYPPSLWHFGTFYLFLVGMFWIGYPEGKNKVSQKKRYLINLLLMFIFCAQIKGAVLSLMEDYSGWYSQSKNVASFIQTNPRWQKAILVSEPDYMVEALPAYLPNPIYMPRQNEFCSYVKFTRINQEDISLDEILDKIALIQKQTGQDVLLLLTHHLMEKGPSPFQIRYDRIKHFSFTHRSLHRLNERSKKIASFREPTRMDENYDLYWFRH